MADPVTVPLNDVQGIVLRGYEKLESARFFLLEITDADAALRWLRGLAADVTSAAFRRAEVQRAVNVAFTCAGLKKLRLDPEAFKGFSREFQEGMDTDHRNRVLGDTSPARLPDRWDWGNRRDAEQLHVLLMLYARPAAFAAHVQEHEQRLAEGGLAVRRAFDPLRLPGRKEHFGFRDGIAQPCLKGVVKEPPDPSDPPEDPPDPSNTINAGEILLGYDNEYGKLPLAPTVPSGHRGVSLSFGTNGSYLVFRQLKQRVHDFWEFIDKAVSRPEQSDAERAAARIRLTSKMVGRWPSGAPLVLTPDADDPKRANSDIYGFRDDPLGTKVPIAAHTRRSNPRDSLEPGPGGLGRLSPEASLRVTRLHRIIRRGRPYGPPLAESMDPGDFLRVPDKPDPDLVDRGLLFLCFNANIARQFEFIQQTWVNNPKFGGLYGDSDPVMGQRNPVAFEEADDVFTLPSEPVRQRALGLNEFVEVRGGGYFFMPGIQALRYLAGLEYHLEPAPPEVPEVVPPGEDEYIEKLKDLLLDKVRRDYPTGLTRRDAHAKHHGCVKARFEVVAGLPDDLRVGLFSEPRSYDAWIRFSNQDGVPRPDSQKDIRGMAIKLLGVEGDKILEDERNAQTQDFILISHNAFVTRDVAEFHDLIRAMTRGFFGLAWFFFNPFRPHLRVFRNLRASMQRHANPLEVRYWSVSPYLFGARAVKYSARPAVTGVTAIPQNPSPDYLREAMKQTLSRGEARFDFMIQLQTDPARMPIEDPGVAWSETLSPFQTVATITIPAQEFDSTEQMAFAENLSFTPWHSLPEHRPLGGINRARKVVYRAVSLFRHERNGVPRQEPTS